jgi:flagellar motility protein MotE (MotC chaperone)
LKLLTSVWGIAIFGAIIHIMTTLMLLSPAVSGIVKPLVVYPDKTEIPEKLWSFKTQALDDLINELKTERTNLVKQQKETVALQSQILAERAEVEKVRDEIRKMREELEKRVVEVGEPELKNLKSLAQTYSLVKGTEAVAIFREMDENNVVKVLSFMKADKVGAVLGEMTKAPDRPGEETMAKRAARISDKLRLLKAPPKAP